MARRILSARDQVEMLSPWRVAADAPPVIHDLMPGVFSDGNGRWDYRHEGSSGDSYVRHEFGIHPTVSPASHTFTDEWGTPHTIHYDPALTGGQVPKPGRFGHEWDNPQALRNEITNLAPPPNMLWRGVSQEEYDLAKERGYFESRGDYNVGGDSQKGYTFFSTDPGQAGNYATWFAPQDFKPTFTHPGHVVGIPDRPELPRGAMPEKPDPRSTEVGVPGRVPFSAITHHYVGRPSVIRSGSQGVVEGWNGWERSGGTQPSSDIVWQDHSPGNHTARHAARRDPHHGEGPWFHGTNADLTPGSILMPGDTVGKAHGKFSDGTRVWVSNDPVRASAYGSRLYEVSPHTRPRSPYANHDEHHTTGADVIREISPEDIRNWRNTYDPSKGWHTAALSDEDRVSVAENIMENAGHGGQVFHIPTATFDDARDHGLQDEHGFPDARGLQRIHSRDAEDYVNKILADRGWEYATPTHRVRVEPEHWDLREPGSGQAVTDGYNYIGLKGNQTNALALLHETAHILTRTSHQPGGHGPEFQKVVHGLYRDHIHPEAADIFAGIAFPDDQRVGKLLYHRTTPENAAAINRSRRFNPGLEKGQRPDAVFFSTNPGDDVGQARDYGDGVVTLNIPDEHFEDQYGEFQGGKGWLDDEFPSGEQHWAIPYQHLRPEWFVYPEQEVPSMREGSRTAAPRTRFTQDWQLIGDDYIPLDVISGYTQRKDTGFGDEKRDQYERIGRPPLSEQVREHGYEKPVELCTDGRSGSIYDGHHRIDVARALGHSHVPVRVTWRRPNPDGTPMFGNKIDPWLKGWLTDMRGGRETV